MTMIILGKRNSTPGGPHLKRRDKDEHFVLILILILIDNMRFEWELIKGGSKWLLERAQIKNFEYLLEQPTPLVFESAAEAVRW
jgi:hypothetical protein